MFGVLNVDRNFGGGEKKKKKYVGDVVRNYGANVGDLKYAVKKVLLKVLQKKTQENKCAGVSF